MFGKHCSYGILKIVVFQILAFFDMAREENICEGLPFSTISYGQRKKGE